MCPIQYIFCITVFLREFLRKEHQRMRRIQEVVVCCIPSNSCLSLVGQTHIRLRARLIGERAERVSKISACKKILNDATSIPRFGKVVRRRASANKDNSTARPLALAWWMNRLSTITSSPRRDAADPPPTAGPGSGTATL